MINLCSKLPRTIAVAVSGGVDSVVALDFLSKNHNVTIVHINHNEGNSDVSEAFVTELANKYSVPLVSYKIKNDRPKSVSREEFWRNERYKVFHQIQQPMITAHTLDDCVETWIWSSMHGCGKIIPVTNRNVVRPFLLTRKSEFVSWANRKKLAWVEDASNKDLTLTRNFIRAQLLPQALVVNPGLHKTISKKVKAIV